MGRRRELARADDLAHQRARRLKIFKEQPFQIFPGWQPLDAVSVLVGAGVIPEVMNFAVGQDDEGGFEIFRVTACLLLVIIGASSSRLASSTPSGPR